ncbi:MAG: ABC transporter ATP-binding protein [Lachnospiraceae bacterium]
MSGGQKQRVWIAMALAQDTKLLFLDEPTTYLDVRYQLDILRLIKRLNREYGITVIMVLHDMNQSLYYSDEIVAMKDGKIIAHGLPEEIITTELVKQVYDVDLQIQKVDGKPFVIPV